MFRNTGKIYFPSQKVELPVYIPRGPPLNRCSRSTQELAVAQVTDWSRSTYQKGDRAAVSYPRDSIGELGRRLLP